MFQTPIKKAMRVEQFVSAFLEPGEQIDATLSYAHTGGY
jgi:hypothetical protein